jgi:6-pyruvoyltetrahydropterin/6-carboxytetrahydropterin synthase
MNVGTEVEIAIAHRLMDYEGKCASLHGHNYRIVVNAKHAGPQGFYYGGVGMHMDFKVLKDGLNSILLRFDHATMLRSDDPLVPVLKADPKCIVLQHSWNPTAENFALFIKSQLENSMPRADWTVRVYETSKSYAEV